MLRTMWSWILYGDLRELILMLILALSLCCYGTYVLIAPKLIQLYDHKIQESALQVHHSHILKQMNNSSVTHAPQVPALPLNELASHYQLATIQKGEFWYFAGSTEHVLNFLHRAYAQSYPIQTFSVEKSTYKTLLVIQQ